MLIDISGALKSLDSAILATQQASDIAVRDAAEVIMSPLRVNLSYSGGKAPIGELGTRTGRLLSQVRAKYFKQRNGFFGVAMKVMGDRRFVMNFNELGTQSHGRVAGFKTLVGKNGKSVVRNGKPSTRSLRRITAARSGNTALPARQVFALTWQAVQASAIATYNESFSRNFQQRMPQS